MLVGLLFMLVPQNDIVMRFPFSTMTVSLEYYIYSIAEKFVLLIFAYIIASEAIKYQQVIWVFFWLLCADLVDYLLTYSGVWFHSWGVPVSMNVVKCVIFGLYILYIWICWILNGEQ